MLKGIYLTLLLLLSPVLSACSGYSPFDYEILHDNVLPDGTRAVAVELPSRLTEDELTELANEIHDETYNVTAIAFALTPEREGQAWAVASFTPDLSVEIYGSTPEEYEVISQKIRVTGDVIGHWVVTGVTIDDHQIAIYKENEIYFSTTLNVDGETSTRRLDAKLVEAGLHLSEEVSYTFNGSHHILKDNGELLVRPRPRYPYTALAL